ncbi:MAG: heterocyst frequency control protein PatD [Leptolyngbyaceae cyanobacterium RU_5_1]|nr:heterocyst frequency control protein PatD [Leptolyngbyaceae cyanobacterium RU_5_1]
MLPLLHQPPYREFRHALEVLRETVSQGSLNPATLKSTVTDLQQVFQTQLLSSNLAELDPTVAQQVQSFQVELDKQLRLLSMDALFWQAAKQSATVQQRQQQVSDRLNILIRYCNALLGEEE